MKFKWTKLADSKFFNPLVFVCMFLIPFFIFRDLYVKDLLLSGGDGYGTYSALLFLKNSLMHGELPLWNKLLSNGVPFAADTSNHAFYIFGILLSWLPDKLYLYSYYAFHVSLGAFFTYLFLKEFGCNKLVSLCMGFIYLLSIHVGGLRKGHIMIIVCIVYLPVILYFIEKYLKTNKIKWLIFSAVAMALQFYNAFIQDVMYTDVIVFIYLLAMGIYNRMRIKKILLHGMIWFFTYIGLIAMQLLPAVEMLKEYGKSGAADMSYEIFTSYSVHYIKLLQMIFPYIFGPDIFGSFGGYASSGFDIEFFMGHFVLLLMVFGIIRYFKDFKIKLSVFILFGTFIYAAQAQIPLLSKILFHIPVLRNMRCPSRTLFIFFFFCFVICGFALSKLRDKVELKAFSKFSLIFVALVVFVILIAAVSVIAVEGSNGFPQDQMIKVFNYFNVTFVKDTLFLVLAVFLVYMFYKVSPRLSDLRYNSIFSVFCLVVMIITIIETYPFSSMSNPGNLADIRLQDNASKQLAKDIGNYKIWDAFPSIDGGHVSIISQSTNLAKGLSAINAYIPLNNPRLYRLFSQEQTAQVNFSGLLTGSIKAAQNLKYQNDLLSMMGVKYIIDSAGLIAKDSSVVKVKGVGKQLLKDNQFTIPNMNGALYVYYKEINILPDTLYKITFEGDFHNSEKDMYYVDFYANEQYDSPNQQASLVLSETKKNYTIYMNSGNCPADGKVLVRLVGFPTSEGIVHNFTVSQVDTENMGNVYVPYYSDDKTTIYINANAKEALYSPKAVKSIASAEDIYNTTFDYSLDDTSYIENFKDMDLTDADTKIDITEFRNNTISARVTSDKASFVNFSQNYYPGWRAYVNGKRVPVYMVNGLIQGIEVPAGESAVEFKFQSTSIYAGGIISLVTLLAAIAVIIIERKKSHNAAK